MYSVNNTVNGELPFNLPGGTYIRLGGMGSGYKDSKPYYILQGLQAVPLEQIGNIIDIVSTGGVHALITMQINSAFLYYSDEIIKDRVYLKTHTDNGADKIIKLTNATIYRENNQVFAEITLQKLSSSGSVIIFDTVSLHDRLSDYNSSLKYLPFAPEVLDGNDQFGN